MCKLITHSSSKLFQYGGFKFAIKSAINLSFRNFYQTYCHVAKNMFVLNGFMKRSYIDIPDLLQAAAVKLQKKSHQRCLLIYHLCSYIHFRRKIRVIIKICKFARISWISKNWKNFTEYFLLVCYGPFDQQLQSILKIYIYLHTHLGYHAKYIFPSLALFPIVLNSFRFLSLDGMFYNFVT